MKDPKIKEAEKRNCAISILHDILLRKAYEDAFKNELKKEEERVRSKTKMDKDRMLNIAERNLKKARIALQQNFNRPGITEKERNILSEKVEYAEIVRELVMGM